MVVYAVWDREARVRFPAPRQIKDQSPQLYISAQSDWSSCVRGGEISSYNPPRYSIHPPTPIQVQSSSLQLKKTIEWPDDNETWHLEW